ncbi:MAG: 2-oxoglutarate dehydrogenase E1 component, partial [Gemmatimonadetes bacterium]|nr:2-oxoglutarate dehydrogenase E1 component [Gemmatimonadota bacterium]NIQ58973.1 2-oxoglutarate dehydrogenase E1 component [Gemmatimonadota bacterium]NIU79180.1 2-oxoglutarate dehydrogenase E1 component [Gammaproteobacteria bacterium]NIX47864.1 2-oxoglutarate dehydrogenase E1 component [Gemmatimonadota bacterium]NIY12235.1 2-oxoglutarate dehydrogenase E1 component [Gemmatimonadota bacterium]
LRHPRAVSEADALTRGGFRLVLDDERAGEHAGDVRRIVLCSGKVYYDLTGSDDHDEAGDVAVVRVEQLYPMPRSALRAVIDRYPGAKEVVWVQEEPANMGAWTYMRPWLQRLAGDDRAVGYVGRPERASPAEGYKKAHDDQQARIVREAFRADPVESPRASVMVKEPGRSGAEAAD